LYAVRTLHKALRFQKVFITKKDILVFLSHSWVKSHRGRSDLLECRIRLFRPGAEV
jgi:hypothetical protein